MSNTDQLFDFSVENQMRFTRLANRKARELEALLVANDKELREFLLTISYPTRRLAIEAKIETILAKYHSGMLQSLQEWADEIAIYAAAVEIEALAISGKQVIDPGTVAILDTVRTQLFQGANMREWANQSFTDDKNRVVRTVRTQMSYGMSGKKVAQAVLEEKRRYGARSQTYRALALLAKSTTMHAFSAGRSSVWAVNEKIVKRLMWVSVLDTHTSDTCRFLDGKTYKINEGPRPPGHLNCRSTMVPLLIGDKLPRKQNWFEWLNNQPSAVQIEALGPTRYRLWKEAGVKPEKFLDEEGEQYTLAELKAKMPAAFRRLRNDKTD